MGVGGGPRRVRARLFLFGVSFHRPPLRRVVRLDSARVVPSSRPPGFPPQHSTARGVASLLSIIPLLSSLSLSLSVYSFIAARASPRRSTAARVGIDVSKSGPATRSRSLLAPLGSTVGQRQRNPTGSDADQNPIQPVATRPQPLPRSQATRTEPVDWRSRWKSDAGH